jgi:transposase-like protein
MRNVLAVVPKGNQAMVAAAIGTNFAQPDADHVGEQFRVIATMLGKQLPKVEQMLREAHHDLLVFTGFPVSHWKMVWSTNPLERLNKEVKRRTASLRSSPIPKPCSDSPARCWSRPTTSGRSPPSVASCLSTPSTSSPAPEHRQGRWPSPNP